MLRVAQDRFVVGALINAGPASVGGPLQLRALNVALPPVDKGLPVIVHEEGSELGDTDIITHIPANGTEIELPETGDVLRSFEKGDISKFVAAGILQVTEAPEDSAVAAATDVVMSTTPPTTNLAPGMLWYDLDPGAGFPTATKIWVYYGGNWVGPLATIDLTNVHP